MKIVEANCVECEKVIEFRSLQEHNHHKIGDFDIPFALHMTLDGTVVVCGGCKTCNRYLFDYGTKLAEVVRCELG